MEDSQPVFGGAGSRAASRGVAREVERKRCIMDVVWLWYIAQMTYKNRVVQYEMV